MVKYNRSSGLTGIKSPNGVPMSSPEAKYTDSRYFPAGSASTSLPSM